MDIRSLVEKITLSDYIGQYCDLEFKNGEYWCLSPFTEEKTPSFSINDDRMSYYDFSSGHGGDVLSFIQKYHKVSFPKAVEIAKQFAGIQEDVQIKEQDITFRVIKSFKKKEIQKHMVEYEILPSDYMSRYEFDLSKLKPWIDEGISPKTLWKFEVRFDNQSNRIVYPIKNLNGEIINVSGRTADPDWKEKKLRKYTYTHPLGVLDVLYGLYENKEAIEDANEVVLFEGAKSVMKAREYGICNTAALLTSHLNELQMKILIGMGVDIVFALDKGIDILEDKHILPLRNFVSVKYICDTENLIREKDSPVDSGKEAFLKLYSKRRWIA